MDTRPVGITLDKAGNVYVVGMAAQAGSGEVWTVRKGTSGTSFATVDIYSGPYGSQAEAIYADPTGGIFAVGSAPIPGTNRPPAKNNSWIVRRSRDGGATWAIVDTFQLTRNWSSRAFGVGADTLGNIYVVGQGNVTGKANTLYGHWVVRKSSDGGTSWSTVDNYQLSTSAHSAAWRFASDSNGNLFVAGWGQATSSGNHHCIVRKSSGGTSTWTTDDDFQYVPGGATDPQAVVANASGNVFVGGVGSSSSGEHWLVRKK